ncbi:MAG TPA: aminotransferase class V-fold PLP-dependent enzyme [Symbiobacteriaceae bacterium]|jgi:aromatic-L-amino-acid decarboxylase|nr:aminotransferase class V-fold PLP-dependent enzyme [Symbiobacteriaceae bacterium]
MVENLGERLGDWTPDELETAGRDVMAAIRDYYAHIDEIPVLTDIQARDLKQLLDSPLPEQSEPFDRILAETKANVIPHLTHWNHPNYFAYFSACSSGPGILADAMISALNVNLFLWKTSPAGSALEQVVLRWLAEMIGYDPSADGVLLNGASLATFYALAAAREATGLNIREEGLIGRDLPVLRCYATEHAHSSIDKAVIALGVGLKNLVKIPGDDQYRMRPDLLEQAIKEDLARGYKPFAVVAVAGTTSTGAVDPLAEVGNICREYGLWMHVDAAYGGLYNLVDEIRPQVDDFNHADSIVINPHKVMFTPLEVTALYSRRKGVLAAAFSLVPEYLRTEPQDGSINYMDFSLQLGRSFRALKLWWIIRSFGRQGIARRMAEHLRLARDLAARIEAHPDLALVGQTPYPLVCFRVFPRDLQAEWATASPERRQAIRAYVDRVSAAALERVNADRQHFISHSALPDGYILRVAIGNIRTTEEHLEALWQKVVDAAAAADRSMRPTWG